MLRALEEVGFYLDVDKAGRRVTVEGRGGEIPNKNADLFLGNAGTAMRFLTAACCLGQGEYVLKGIPRMHERPIGQLVDALRELGADIEYLGNEGYPPLRIKGKGLRGGEVEMDPSTSSQFVSALLIAGAGALGPITLSFEKVPVSIPYIDMTFSIMERFGYIGRPGIAKHTTRLIIKPYKYRRTDHLAVEPDASNASYFLGAAAMFKGASVRINGFGTISLQGDSFFAHDCLRSMGCTTSDHATATQVVGAEKLQGIDIDLNKMPDMAQTLAVVALFADGPTTIRDVGNLRVKETDRMAALETELTKLGAIVDINGDDIRITPPPNNILLNAANNQPMSDTNPVFIDTYDDHRMAMAFSIAGLRQPGLRINDPACVNKTFPEFFEYLNRLHKHVKAN